MPEQGQVGEVIRRDLERGDAELLEGVDRNTRPWESARSRSSSCHSRGSSSLRKRSVTVSPSFMWPSRLEAVMLVSETISSATKVWNFTASTSAVAADSTRERAISNLPLWLDRKSTR